MRTVWSPVRLPVAASLAAVTALAAKPPEFPQATGYTARCPSTCRVPGSCMRRRNSPATKPARSRRGRIAPSRARSCATLACAHFFSTRNAQYAPTSEALRCHEAIAFVLHQCAAQRRPAAGAPLSPPPHGRGTNSLDVIACRCCGRRVGAGIGPDGFGVLVDARPVARLVTGRVGYRLVAGRRTPRFAEVTSGTTGHVYREHWQRCRISRAARLGW